MNFSVEICHAGGVTIKPQIPGGLVLELHASEDDVLRLARQIQELLVPTGPRQIQPAPAAPAASHGCPPGIRAKILEKLAAPMDRKSAAAGERDDP